MAWGWLPPCLDPSTLSRPWQCWPKEQSLNCRISLPSLKTGNMGMTLKWRTRSPTWRQGLNTPAAKSLLQMIPDSLTDEFPGQWWSLWASSWSPNKILKMSPGKANFIFIPIYRFTQDINWFSQDDKHQDIWLMFRCQCLTVRPLLPRADPSSSTLP